MGLSLLIVLSWEIWIGVTNPKWCSTIAGTAGRVVEQSKQVQAGLGENWCAD
jgi:hypothetical protein